MGCWIGRGSSDSSLVAIVLALVGEALLAGRQADHLHRLAQPGAARALRRAEAVELVGAVAHPEAERDPPTGKYVEGGGDLGGLHGVVERKQHGVGGEADPARHRRRGGQGLQRERDELVVHEVVFTAAVAVESQALRLDRVVDVALVAVRQGVGHRPHLGEADARSPEFHSSLSFAFRARVSGLEQYLDFGREAVEIHRAAPLRRQTKCEIAVFPRSSRMAFKMSRGEPPSAALVASRHPARCAARAPPRPRAARGPPRPPARDSAPGARTASAVAMSAPTMGEMPLRAAHSSVSSSSISTFTGVWGA